MQRGPSEPITSLLWRWRDGDIAALDVPASLVRGELRRLVQFYPQREVPGHTLQSTPLVHEAYTPVAGQKVPDWPKSAHFVGVAVHLMREIFSDDAPTFRALERTASA